MTEMKSSSPLISVVVPVYNGEKFVPECLDSIARQTYRPVEIVVVDDGSTDGSVRAAEGHPSAPVVLKTPHANLPSARNAGIRKAGGACIALCDIDDLWHPEKLARQALILENNPDIGLVFTAVATFGPDPARARARRPTGRELAFNRGNQFALLALRSIIAPSSVLVRKEVLNRIGPFDESLDSCEDYDLWLRLARAGVRMHRIAAPLTLYRRHGGNMSEKTDVMHRNRLKVLEKAFAGLPADAKTRALKNGALARAFYEAANCFYSAGDVKRFNECYAEGRRYGPALLSFKALRRRIREIVRGR
jgi:glycosyltransferase involved in cell wall biosynthesis